MPGRNARRSRATALAALSLALALVAAPGAGRGPDHAWGPSGGPSTEEAVGAWLAARRWTDDFTPPDPGTAAARLPLPGASAACVILRKRGRVVGNAVDFTGDDLMVRRALGRALSEVLGNPGVAALPDDMRDDLGRGLTLEVEVAGPLVPLPGRTFRDLADQIEPGLDGIAMRRTGADDALALRFPSQMLATGTAGRVEGQLPALAADLGLPVRPWTELRDRWGARLYRFRTIHLAQRAPGRQPFETFRGQVIEAESSITTARIAEMTQDLANHLITSLWPGTDPLGVMGNYDGIADDYLPRTAPPREQALVAFALARCAAAGALDASMRERTALAAATILAQLDAQAGVEEDPRADPLACAAIVYACAELPPPDETDPLRAEMLRAAAAVVLGAFHPERGFVGGGGGGQDPLPAHAQAVLAGATARLLVVDPGRVGREFARRAADAAWASAPGPEAVTLLPWIAWAEQDIARATGAPAPPERIEALLALAGALEASRIGSALLPGPPDLRGGFALTRGARVTADAQSTRPAAFLASALRDPALTPPGEAAAALGRHLSTVRFLSQLMVGDSLLRAVPAPQRALGGIRSATWQLDQPVAAQAMAMLALAETLVSLEALALREEAP